MVVLSAMSAAAVDRDLQRLNDDYCAAYNAGDLEKYRTAGLPDG